MPSSSLTPPPAPAAPAVHVRWTARGGGLTPEIKETVKAMDQWQIGLRRWRNRLETLFGEMLGAADQLTPDEISPAMADLASRWVTALTTGAAQWGLTDPERAQYQHDLDALTTPLAAALTRMRERLTSDLAHLDTRFPQEGGPRRVPLDLEDLLPPQEVPAADALRLLTHPRESVRRQVFRPEVEADGSGQERGVLSEWFSVMLEARDAETPSLANVAWSPYGGHRPTLLSQSRPLPRIRVTPTGTRELRPPALAPVTPAGGHFADRARYLELLERLCRIPLRGQMQTMLDVWQTACDTWMTEAQREGVTWTPTLLELAASCAEARQDLPVAPQARAGWWGQSPAMGCPPAVDTPLAPEALTGLSASAQEAIWKRRTPHAMRLQFARRAPQAMDPVWLQDRAASLEADELAALAENPGYGDVQRRALLRAAVTVLLREPAKRERWQAFLLTTRRELQAPWLDEAQAEAIHLKYRGKFQSHVPVPELVLLVPRYQEVLFPASTLQPAMLAKGQMVRLQVYREAVAGFTGAEWCAALALAAREARDQGGLSDTVVHLLEHVPSEVAPETLRQHARPLLLSTDKGVREAAIRAVGQVMDPSAGPATSPPPPSRKRQRRF